jgi:putative peptidoglycan lipid II flippase
VAGRIAAAAALIAVLTIAARVVGFARTVVLAQTVGTLGLSDLYLAANTVPNIVFEIVAGGALAGLVVPLLAGPLATGDKAAVRQLVSTLLTYALAALIPLAVIVALAAGPIIDLLAPDVAADQRQAAISMLRVFAPQLPLYGIGIVLAGVLQAHRRFAWPVIAPLLSSLTVIGSYTLFAVYAGRTPEFSTVDHTELMILAVGTTLGVVVLTLSLLIPVSRLKITMRPSLTLPAGQRRLVGGLALAGALTVAAQQIALFVTVKLALAGSVGTNAVYTLAQTVYLLPWAVLAVPAATAAYPTIATAHATGDQSRLDATVARTGRAIALFSGLGVAGLVAVAPPVAALLTPEASGPEQARALSAAITAFAPGLLGYGIVALHQRTLYAIGGQRLTAAGIGLGWAVTLVGALIAADVVPKGDRATALAAANSLGMTVMGLALAWAVRSRRGPSALTGLWRATLAAALAALVGGVAGRLLPSLAAGQDTPGVPVLLAQGMLAGGVAVLVFIGACALLDRSDLMPVLAKVRGLGRRLGGRRRDGQARQGGDER